MFHKFVDFYMATINHILYPYYVYIKSLFENYPRLSFYFHSCSSQSHVAHTPQELFLLVIRKGLFSLCTRLELVTLYFQSALLDWYECRLGVPCQSVNMLRPVAFYEDILHHVTFCEYFEPGLKPQLQLKFHSKKIIKNIFFPKPDVDVMGFSRSFVFDVTN